MRYLVVVGALAACTDSFTETEALAVAQNVPAVCQTPPALFGVEPCARGGKVRIAGTVIGTLDAYESGTLTLDGTAAFDDCSIDDDTVLVASEMATSSTCMVSGGRPSRDNTHLAGTFDWERDGGSGSCEVELVIANSYGRCLLGEGSCVYETEIHGEVCAHPVNRRCMRDLISSCRDL